MIFTMNAMNKTVAMKAPWLAVTLFAIAMGLLETIVVVYLRELYYPEGFQFPLKAMSQSMIQAELLRELATLVMLVAIGWIAGHRGTTRFAWFIYAFAVWDIFYYVFLELLLSWPASLVTWDVLFLIPFTWVGPVLAPLINSLCMILLAILLIHPARSGPAFLQRSDWLLLITGSLVVILAYTLDYLQFMLKTFSFPELLDQSKVQEIMTAATTYIPHTFPWWIFLTGVAMHLAVILRLLVKKKSA